MILSALDKNGLRRYKVLQATYFLTSGDAKSENAAHARAN